MKKFMGVHTLGDVLIAVNIDQIVSIRPYPGNNGSPLKTRIEFSNERTIDVTETFVEITEWLRAT